MGLIALTKEQILNGIVAPFVKVLSFALSLIPDKELVKEIVADIQTSVAQVNVETPPTQEEAVYAILAVADTAALATTSTVDDTLVDVAQAGADFAFKRGSGWSAFITLLKLRKKSKEEAKGN